jgi:hypothetical protein
MDLFTRANLRSLVADHAQPCVSIFMPTHRGGSQEDPIRFRKLVARAHEGLIAYGLRTSQARDLLAPLHSLLEDASFWANQCDGLAVFLARDFLRVYRLPWTFAEELEVGGFFLVAPLLPLLHGDGRYYVLALSQNSVRLFQGTRFTVSPVDLKGVPHSLAEALRTHDRDEVLTYHAQPTAGGSWGAIFHGLGLDDAKDNQVRYFQAIDRGLHEVLREERAPLVVAAVEYLAALYREVNTYPHLLKQAIEGNPDRLSEAELHARAWALVEPGFQEAQRRAVRLYHQAAAAGSATADVFRIIPAAYRGEVETAFVALGQHLLGVLDPNTNEVSLHTPPAPGDEDLLNFTAIHTLRHGNTVYAVRPEDLPAGQFLAAIYHLPLPGHGKRP